MANKLNFTNEDKLAGITPDMTLVETAARRLVAFSNLQFYREFDVNPEDRISSNQFFARLNNVVRQTIEEKGLELVNEPEGRTVSSPENTFENVCSYISGYYLVKMEKEREELPEEVQDLMDLFVSAHPFEVNVDDLYEAVKAKVINAYNKNGGAGFENSDLEVVPYVNVSPLTTLDEKGERIFSPTIGFALPPVKISDFEGFSMGQTVAAIVEDSMEKLKDSGFTFAVTQIDKTYKGKPVYQIYGMDSVNTASKLKIVSEKELHKEIFKQCVDCVREYDEALPSAKEDFEKKPGLYKFRKEFFVKNPDATVYDFSLSELKKVVDTNSFGYIDKRYGKTGRGSAYPEFNALYVGGPAEFVNVPKYVQSVETQLREKGFGEITLPFTGETVVAAQFLPEFTEIRNQIVNQVMSEEGSEKIRKAANDVSRMVNIESDIYDGAMFVEHLGAKYRIPLVDNVVNLYEREYDTVKHDLKLKRKVSYNEYRENPSGFNKVAFCFTGNITSKHIDKMAADILTQIYSEENIKNGRVELNSDPYAYVSKAISADKLDELSAGKDFIVDPDGLNQLFEDLPDRNVVKKGEVINVADVEMKISAEINKFCNYYNISMFNPLMENNGKLEIEAVAGLAENSTEKVKFDSWMSEDVVVNNKNVGKFGELLKQYYYYLDEDGYYVNFGMGTKSFVAGATDNYIELMKKESRELGKFNPVFVGEVDKSYQSVRDIDLNPLVDRFREIVRDCRENPDKYPDAKYVESGWDVKIPGKDTFIDYSGIRYDVYIPQEYTNPELEDSVVRRMCNEFLVNYSRDYGVNEFALSFASVRPKDNGALMFDPKWVDEKIRGVRYIESRDEYGMPVLDSIEMPDGRVFKRNMKLFKDNNGFNPLFFKYDKSNRNPFKNVVPLTVTKSEAYALHKTFGIPYSEIGLCYDAYVVRDKANNIKRDEFGCSPIDYKAIENLKNYQFALIAETDRIQESLREEQEDEDREKASKDDREGRDDGKEYAGNGIDRIEPYIYIPVEDEDIKASLFVNDIERIENEIYPEISSKVFNRLYGGSDMSQKIVFPEMRSDGREELLSLYAEKYPEFVKVLSAYYEAKAMIRENPDLNPSRIDDIISSIQDKKSSEYKEAVLCKQKINESSVPMNNIAGKIQQNMLALGDFYKNISPDVFITGRGYSFSQYNVFNNSSFVDAMLGIQYRLLAVRYSLIEKEGKSIDEVNKIPDSEISKMPAMKYYVTLSTNDVRDIVLGQFARTNKYIKGSFAVGDEMKKLLTSMHVRYNLISKVRTGNFDKFIDRIPGKVLLNTPTMRDFVHFDALNYLNDIKIKNADSTVRVNGFIKEELACLATRCDLANQKSSGFSLDMIKNTYNSYIRDGEFIEKFRKMSVAELVDYISNVYRNNDSELCDMISYQLKCSASRFDLFRKNEKGLMIEEINNWPRNFINKFAYYVFKNVEDNDISELKKDIANYVKQTGFCLKDSGPFAFNEKRLVLMKKAIETLEKGNVFADHKWNDNFEKLRSSVKAYEESNGLIPSMMSFGEAGAVIRGSLILDQFRNDMSQELLDNVKNIYDAFQKGSMLYNKEIESVFEKANSLELPMFVNKGKTDFSNRRLSQDCLNMLRNRYTDVEISKMDFTEKVSIFKDMSAKLQEENRAKLFEPATREQRNLMKEILSGNEKISKKTASEIMHRLNRSDYTVKRFEMDLNLISPTDATLAEVGHKGLNDKYHALRINNYHRNPKKNPLVSEFECRRLIESETKKNIARDNSFMSSDQKYFFDKFNISYDKDNLYLDKEAYNIVVDKLVELGVVSIADKPCMRSDAAELINREKIYYVNNDENSLKNLSVMLDEKFKEIRNLDKDYFVKCYKPDNSLSGRAVNVIKREEKRTGKRFLEMNRSEIAREVLKDFFSSENYNISKVADSSDKEFDNKFIQTLKDIIPDSVKPGEATIEEIYAKAKQDYAEGKLLSEEKSKDSNNKGSNDGPNGPNGNDGR